MKVLIATVTAGAGHLQAAAALEEAWRAERPGDTVERLDVLDFTPAVYRKAYVEGYVQLVEHAPELWGFLFDRTDNPTLNRRLTRLRQGLARLTAAAFVRELRRFKPEVVLCTHYLPLDSLGRLKRTKTARLDPDPFVVSVVTDFEAHALWMDHAVDLYCVAAEETKARLVARGAASEAVTVTGIPVALKFAAPVDAPAVRRRLGLRDDLATLLVLGGGFGMGPVEAILREVNTIIRPLQLVVVCGRNQELQQALAVAVRRHPTHVLGYVTNMHELMAVAELVITKPGGLTTSEALAVGRPLFIVNPIPGQEAANSDFLLEHGAAAKANRVEDLPFRLERLLGTPRLREMAQAAKALGRPLAAATVCHEVVRRTTHSTS